MPPRINHLACRTKVCAVCFAPAGKIDLTKSQLMVDHIKVFAQQEYSISDARLPTSLCSSCQRWLYNKANNKTSSMNDPHIFDIASLPNLTHDTKNFPVEDYEKNVSNDHCYLCEVAHSTGRAKQTYNPWANPGTPKNPPTPKLLLNSKCKCQITPLVQHNCSKKEEERNLSDFLNKSPSPCS